VDRVMADWSVVRPVDEVESRLGYRGMVITGDSDGIGVLKARGLPPIFRLRETVNLDVSDVTERWLLHTSGADEMVVPEALDASEAVVGSPRATFSNGAEPTCETGTRGCTIWWTSRNDLNTFWNGSTTRIQNNNCYNFASSLATNTFAQPGRGSGQMFTALTIANIKAAAYRDGYTSSCSGDRFEDYLCIWPNLDYHWYHRSTDVSGSRRWAHKPGSTRATNLDSSGKIITNPATCDRGRYTVDGSPTVFAPVSPKAKIK
ncbi:MAG: hypothetical protein FWD55_05245, partial [Propionibacteriaceae bacterium]|nr:hypothetical protein [Propionibacteriaceae bacterium]